jgi:putative oxidoreductase
MWAGLAKWFVWSGPPPEMADWMINLTTLLSVVEPLGAVAVIFGFLTRWAAAGLAIIMLGSLYFVYFMFHVGIFTSEKGAGMDYNLLLLAGSLVLVAFGPGGLSLDALRRTRS